MLLVGACVAEPVDVTLCVCVSDGLEKPDWLAVSVDLCVPLGVRAAVAEPVAVLEAEEGSAMTTRRRMLFMRSACRGRTAGGGGDTSESCPHRYIPSPP
jgi:hypothetical protein